MGPDLSWRPLALVHIILNRTSVLDKRKEGAGYMWILIALFKSIRPYKTFTGRSSSISIGSDKPLAYSGVLVSRSERHFLANRPTVKLSVWPNRYEQLFSYTNFPFIRLSHPISMSNASTTPTKYFKYFGYDIGSDNLNSPWHFVGVGRLKRKGQCKNTIQCI